MRILKRFSSSPKLVTFPFVQKGQDGSLIKEEHFKRVIDRYSAYINHLSTLSEDFTVHAEDRACLKGYLNKWSDCKILVGCALYIEVLKPPSILSLTLQGSNIDIVSSIKSILKTISTLKSLTTQDPLQWSAVKQVLERIEDDGVEKTYQGAVVSNYNESVIEYCKQQALSDLKRLNREYIESIRMV